MPQPAEKWDSERDGKRRAQAAVLGLRGLKPGPKIVLQRMLELTDEAGASSLPALIVTSATLIAAGVGEEARTVQRHLKVLALAGFIKPKDKVSGGRTEYEVSDPREVCNGPRVVSPSPQAALFDKEGVPGELATNRAQNLTPENARVLSFPQGVATNLVPDLTQGPGDTLTEAAGASPVFPDPSGYDDGECSRALRVEKHPPNNDDERRTNERNGTASKANSRQVVAANVPDSVSATLQSEKCPPDFRSGGHADKGRACGNEAWGYRVAKRCLPGSGTRMQEEQVQSPQGDNLGPGWVAASRLEKPFRWDTHSGTVSPNSKKNPGSPITTKCRAQDDHSRHRTAFRPSGIARHTIFV